MQIITYTPKQTGQISPELINQIKTSLDRIKNYFKVDPGVNKVSAEELGVEATGNYAKAYQERCAEIYSRKHPGDNHKCDGSGGGCWGS